MVIRHEENPPAPPESLASRLRQLEVGEALVFDNLERVGSVRVMANRTMKQTGRRFKTAKANGCLRVWRIS